MVSPIWVDDFSMLSVIITRRQSIHRHTLSSQQQGCDCQNEQIRDRLQAIGPQLNPPSTIGKFTKQHSMASRQIGGQTMNKTCEAFPKRGAAGTLWLLAEVSMSETRPLSSTTSYLRLLTGVSFPARWSTVALTVVEDGANLKGSTAIDRSSAR